MTAIFIVLLSDKLFDKGFNNTFTRSDGIVILLFFLVFVYYLIKMARNKIDKSQDEKYMSMKKAILFTILGIASVVT